MVVAEDLEAFLERAYSGPGCLPVERSNQRYAILALAIHVLLVKAGFVSETNEGSWNFKKNSARIWSTLNPMRLFRKNIKYVYDFKPPPYWLCLNPNPEFVFRYTLPGKQGVFGMYISVHESTDRMFVNFSEDCDMCKARILGLTVNNTVPDSSYYKDSQIQINGWKSVLINHSYLIHNVERYLIKPALKNAKPLLPETRSMDPLEDEILNNENGKENDWPPKKWITRAAFGIVVGYFVTRYIMSVAKGDKNKK